MKKSQLTPFAKLSLVVLTIVGLIFGLYVSGVLKIPLTTSDIKNTDDYGIGIDGGCDLVISGSPTIGDKIVPGLLRGYLDKKGIKYEFVAVDAEQQYVKFTENDKETKVLIKATGTGTGFADLEKDPNIIVMATRQIDEKEIEKLGNLTSKQTENVIACDGIAVIVNAGTKIDLIEKSNVIKIYTGEITEWSQLGIDKAGKIKLYALPQLAIDGKTLSSTAIKVTTNQEAVSMVSSDLDGIGLISMLYVSSDIKLVPVSDGKSKKFYPNKLTVGTEDYPLTRKLYFYTSGSNNNALAKQLVQFALSKDGQKIIGESGFVEFNTTEMTDKPYSNLPPGAKRISINFRFNSGSMELDNKSLIDVGRLAEKTEITSASVYLVGFADAQGSDMANLDLSVKRAKAVETELETVGIKVAKVFGLGKEYPVASNETDEGRQKNRRVEIWIVK